VLQNDANPSCIFGLSLQSEVRKQKLCFLTSKNFPCDEKQTRHHQKVMGEPDFIIKD